MKTSIKRIVALVLAVILSLALVACGGSNKQLQEIDGQEYISKSDSADGNYTVTAYLNDGQSSDYAVLCTVTDNPNGETRNIYWNDNCANANIQWVNNDTVVINGTVVNVKNGGFDYRDHQ